MKKPILLIGIAAVILVLISIGRHGRGEAVAEVELQPAAERTIRSSILASGRVAHDAEVTLTSETIGIVRHVLVDEGQRVERGQLVLEIRDDEHTATVDQHIAQVTIQDAEVQRAQLNARRMRDQAERARRLYGEHLISRDVYEKSVLDYELAEVDLTRSLAAQNQARAALAQARNRLAKTRIYSPIEGVVVSVDIKAGETAIPSVGGIAGSTLMVIADPASMYVEVNVDEADIGNVGIGDQAEIVAVAFSSRPLQGKLFAMSNTARVAPGRQGLSFAVKIRPEDVEGVQLRSGMSCRTEIFSAARAAVLTAPISAVQVEEDRIGRSVSHYVFVSRENTAVKVAVDVGIADDDYQEIAGGVEAGDQLIVGPARVLRDLRNGDAVRAAMVAPASGVGTAAQAR